jgi:hypothetical protein
MRLRAALLRPTRMKYLYMLRLMALASSMRMHHAGEHAFEHAGGAK